MESEAEGRTPQEIIRNTRSKAGQCRKHSESEAEGRAMQEIIRNAKPKAKQRINYSSVTDSGDRQRLSQVKLVSGKRRRRVGLETYFTFFEKNSAVGALA